MLPRIGISFLGITPEMGGNYQYALTLLEDLETVSDRAYELVVFINDLELVDVIRNVSPRVAFVHVKLEESSIFIKIGRMIIGLTGLRLKPKFLMGPYVVLDESNCFVIFFPFWHVASFLMNTPCVASIHDCAPREAPEFMSWSVRVQLDVLIKAIVKHAKFILVDSVYGKNLLCKHYQAKRDVVIAHPFRPEPSLMVAAERASSETANIREKFRLRKEYLLLPGRWGSYKNTERVLEALALLYKRGLSIPDFVLTGIKQEEALVAKKYIEQRGLNDCVHLLGFVSTGDLALLYQNAQALVFPTLLGPTSIPIYEAFALGCPVITSQLSGYPELVGEAAILVNPLDVGSIADAILKVSNDVHLRENLKKAGIERFHELSQASNQRGTLAKILKDTLVAQKSA